MHTPAYDRTPFVATIQIFKLTPELKRVQSNPLIDLGSVKMETAKRKAKEFTDSLHWTPKSKRWEYDDPYTIKRSYNTPEGELRLITIIRV